MGKTYGGTNMLKKDLSKTENIRKTEQVHTISCLVQSVSPKIREGLKKLGYIYYTLDEKAEYILVDPYTEDFTWWEYTEETLAKVFDTWGSTKLYDCGTNEDLFLALAALREDNDYMQWFASNYISKYYPDRPESIHQCKTLDYKDFFGDCPYTSNYDDYHKMTADEIVKEFSKIANIKHANSEETSTKALKHLKEKAMRYLKEEKSERTSIFKWIFGINVYNILDCVGFISEANGFVHLTELGEKYINEYNFCETKSNPTYIWIAREEDIEDKYSDAYIPGKLNLFYDKPSYVYNSEKRREEWGCARKIAEIPNYMYPDVTFENSPVKLKTEV